MMLDCYILSGGRSRRFGSDKGRMPIDGVPNLLRLHQALAPDFLSSPIRSQIKAHSRDSTPR